MLSSKVFSKEKDLVWSLLCKTKNDVLLDNVYNLADLVDIHSFWIPSPEYKAEFMPIS